MQICRSLAGYSYARADNVRRAMSKKKESVMKAERQDFVNGAVAGGVSKDVAEDIFEEMLGFAQYAFNKSHATAYGILSYRTAYLKAHYPTEYFAALLTSVLDNNTKVREYILDAQKFCISVLSPDINASREAFATDGKNIRYGLLAIKNVGRNFAKAVIAERSRGKYKSFDSFVARLIDSDINKRTVESMIKCGVFDSLGVTRSALISCFENIVDSEHDKVRNNISGQMDMFSQAVEVSSNVGYKYPDVPEYSMRELLSLEKESSGMYFSGQLIDDYTKHIAAISPDSISEIISDMTEEEMNKDIKYRDRSKVKIAGIVTAKRTKQVKGGEMMAFVTLEDRFAEIEVIVFAKQYKMYSELLSEESAVIITGALSSEDSDAPRLLLSAAEKLLPNDEYLIIDQKNEAERKNTTEKRLYVKVLSLSDDRINRLTRICALNRGNVNVVLYDDSAKKYSLMKGATVREDNDVIRRIESVFGEGNVIIK